MSNGGNGCAAQSQAYDDALDALQQAWNDLVACLGGGGAQAAEPATRDLHAFALMVCGVRFGICMAELRALAKLLNNLPK